MTIEPLTEPRRAAFRRVLAGVVVAMAALCESVAAQTDPPGWSAQITPYVWGAGVGGSIRPLPGAPTVEFDESFSDLLENLDAALFLTGYARLNRFVVLSDFSYASSSRSGLARLPAIGLVPAEGRLRQTAFTLAAGYRLLGTRRVNLDVLGGFRAWSLGGEVDLAGGLISRSPGASFADPIVAARANLALASRWSAILYGDIGGFGVGSEHTGQLLGTVNVRVATPFYLSAGYRYLTADYDDGRTRVDASMAGPLVGATWRF